MKNLSVLRLTLLAAAPALLAQDQTRSGFYRPFTLAPAEVTSSDSGGGATVDDQQAADAALVKKSLNPVADLISAPIQNNWDFGIGPANAMQYTAKIQPVIPFGLNKDWNLITRTILPVIYAESPVEGGENHSGLGDTTQSFFFSPKAPVGGWTLGGGPILLYPTATDSALGSGKWGAGPTIVALQQQHGFTYGLLASHTWSFAGWGDESVNATYLQPFLSYSLKTFTTFGMNTESTYDWEASQWTVPLNFYISQLLKIGNQPISLQVGYRYYAEGPTGGPEWGLRFTVTFLFPKK